MDQKHNPGGFDFSVFWHNFLRTFPRLMWIPLLLCAGAAGFKYYTITRSYVPSYEVSAVYRVSANSAGSMDITTFSYYLDTNAADRLATSFPYVISSDQGRKLLESRYGSPTLPASVSLRAEATLLVFTARGSDPKRTYDALRMAAEIYPEAAKGILMTFSLEPFDVEEMPTAPTNTPNYLMPTLRWGLMGLALGLAIVALFAYFRKTVHNSEDLRELINVPCLGLLPTVRFKARSKGDNTVLLTNPKLDESYAEGIRAIRFQLGKELEHQKAKVIMITSTSPGEGKTSLSANLALSLSEQGRRVVLVDCDLRKQALKDVFAIKESTKGLVELIAEQNGDLEDSLLTVEGSDLRLLSGDKVAQQPQNFLSSPRLQGIMTSLRRHFDYVIVDTPPSGLLSDAASLSAWVDGVIYVVRQDYVSRSAILDSTSSLSGVDLRFIGCVLNQTARSTSSNGYGYSSRRGYGYGGYGYGYGYGYGGYGGYSRKKYRGKDAAESESYQK